MAKIGVKNAKDSDVVTDKDTKTMHTNSKRVQSDSSHWMGIALSGNMVKRNIKGGTESSLSKCTSSEMKYNPRKPYELLNKNQETEAVCTPDIHMNKPAGAYDLGPPNLTDSEF